MSETDDNKFTARKSSFPAVNNNNANFAGLKGRPKQQQQPHLVNPATTALPALHETVIPITVTETPGKIFRTIIFHSLFVLTDTLNLANHG